MRSEGEKRALENSWAITCRHLEAAKECLMDRHGISKEALGEYQGFLDHNELELALDELEAVGEATKSDRHFWKFLLLAAENMSLSRHAARYREKGRSTP
jgi:hypothetical protein